MHRPQVPETPEFWDALDARLRSEAEAGSYGGRSLGAFAWIFGLQRILSPVALALVMIVSIGVLRSLPVDISTESSIVEASIPVRATGGSASGDRAPVRDHSVFLIDGAIDPREVPPGRQVGRLSTPLPNRDVS